LIGFGAFNRSVNHAKFAQSWGPVMADRSALGAIGLMLSTATVLVMMVGTLVVSNHLTGRLQIDDGLRVVTLPSAAR
jgi:hypothetical protein